MSAQFSRRKALVLGGGLAASAAVTATVGATSASASTGWIRLPVVTANIGRNNPAAREPGIRDVRWKADPGHWPLVGWQEIYERPEDNRERDFIAKHFARKDFAHPFLLDGKSFRVPMSVPAQWKVVSQRKTFVHGGISGVSPTRYINEAVLRHVKHPELEFALINTHYIRDPKLPQWEDHRKAHSDRVLAHHKQGRAVIWTGDTNLPTYAKATGWKKEKQVFHNGRDRINWMVGDGKVQLKVLGTRTVDLRVDGHDARVAIFGIRLA